MTTLIGQPSPGLNSGCGHYLISLDKNITCSLLQACHPNQQIYIHNKKKLNRERNANPSINKHCAVQYASHLLFELDFSDCSKYKGVDICPLYYSTWCPLSWSQLFNTQLFTSKPVKIRSNYMVNVHLPF